MKIYFVDDLPPQTVAMLQSLYSRSPKSVIEHLETVTATGAEKFMDQYYVGYGHKSIGDCGTTTIFLEDVSMLAAKAIQDTPLYNGQEASTRYMDMASRPLVDPAGIPEATELQRLWMELYRDTLTAMTRYFEIKYPIQPGERESTWKKAILARAFDVSRGFLPAGVTTFVSWHTNLRQAADRLRVLNYHPLPEVRQLSQETLTDLKESYTASFSHRSYSESEEFLAQTVPASTYDHQSPYNVYGLGSLRFYDTKTHFDHRHLWEKRPAKTELPRATEAFGKIRFTFSLDFGSYRDLQRHRSAYQPMPVLTNAKFHWWYMNQILQTPEGTGLQKRFLDATERLHNLVRFLRREKGEKLGTEFAQYYVPMGYEVGVTLDCSLASAVYIAELRSGQSVHPTLRAVAQGMASYLAGELRVPVHADMGPDLWSTRRGDQDIVAKPVPGSPEDRSPRAKT